MSKKIILAVVILALGFASFFLLTTREKRIELKDLGKNLPEDLKVFQVGDIFEVSNKTDGYFLRMPETWKGFKNLTYSAKKEIDEPKTLLILEGKQEGDLLAVGVYWLKDKNADLNDWLAQLLEKSKELNWQREQKKAGKTAVIKVTENKYLAGLTTYFFKKGAKIYEISGFSEEALGKIIGQGRWGK